MIWFSHSLPDGADYIYDSTNLTFPTGSAIGDRQCVMVSIVDDEAVELTEQFHLELSTSNPQVQLPSLLCNRAVFSISDSDGEIAYTLLAMIL